MTSTLLGNPYLFEYYGVVLVLLFLFGITSLFTRFHTLRTILGVGLILMPILYFYLIVETHTINIPYTDDFNVLETVQKFRQESDYIQAAKILFQQVNQHRFAFERLVILAIVYLTGTVDIKFQIMLGNLFLLGILYILFLAVRKEGINWYYFIPIPYLLFNLAYYENANWGIAAIQNTPLIFFALLVFYWLNRADSRGLFLGLLASIVATFISGTGMLTLLVGALLLLFQKRYRSLLLWMTVTTAILLFYFMFDYRFIPSNSENLWKYPLFNALLLFGFWGNAVFMDIPHPVNIVFYPDTIVCIIVGLGIAAVFLAWVLRYFMLNKKHLESYWFFLGAFLFMLGTGAMFVMSRPLNFYFMYGGSVFSRRYMLFGVVLLGVSYLVVLVMTKKLAHLKTGVTILGLLCFLGLNFQSYFMSIVQLREQREKLTLDPYYWKNYSTFLSMGSKFGDVPFWNHPTRMKQLVQTVEAGGISNFYAADRLPDSRSLRSLALARSGLYGGEFNTSVEYRIDEFNLRAEYLHFYVTKDRDPPPSWFLLASESHTIVLPAVPLTNSLEEFLKTRNYYSARYHYGLFRAKLPSGTYKVWIVPEAEDEPYHGEPQSTLIKVVLSDEKRVVDTPEPERQISGLQTKPGSIN